MSGEKQGSFGEALRLMARLAQAKSEEEVLAQVEYIGLFVLGVTAVRAGVEVPAGSLQRRLDLLIDGVSWGPAILLGVGRTTLVWSGRSFSDAEVETLAPVVPVAQATLERLQGSLPEPQAKRVRGSDAMVSALVESIEDPVWLLDADLRLQAFNSAFDRLFAETFAMTPAVGNSVLGIPEPFRSAHLQLYRDVMAHGPRRLDWQIPGRERVLDVFMHPIRIGTEVTGVAVSCRDVTRDRSTARRLEEARKEAERANQAKTDFLAQMSHEIRTPLNAIIGLTDLAARQPLDEPVRDLVDRVQRSSKALLHLVSGVLDFSRIEAGRLQVESAPMDLAATLRDALEMLAERAARQQLTLTLELADDLPERVRSDPGRVRQIVVILLDNALKYTVQGGVVVRAGVRDQRLRIDVEDTGPGLTTEQLERIFERFVRLEEHRRVGGTGLGLAIARSLAQALQGELTASSVPGDGSCFTLELPLDVVRWGAGQGELRQTGSLRRRLSVLVVDDAPSNLAVTRALLERGGHQVTTVASGEQALEKLGEAFDLVLMDLDMPGIDGLEATRRWRASGDDTPIVAMTAHAVPQVLASCEQAGMQGTLVKPVPPATLEEQVLHFGRPPRLRLLHDDPEVVARAARWLTEVGAQVVEEEPALTVRLHDEARAELIERVEALLDGPG